MNSDKKYFELKNSECFRSQSVSSSISQFITKYCHSPALKIDRSIWNYIHQAFDEKMTPSRTFIQVKLLAGCKSTILHPLITDNPGDGENGHCIYLFDAFRTKIIQLSQRFQILTSSSRHISQENSISASYRPMQTFWNGSFLLIPRHSKRENFFYIWTLKTLHLNLENVTYEL